MKSLAMINLVAGLIVFVMVLAKVIPPWAQARYKVEAPQENWSTLTLKDPKLDSAISSISRAWTSQAILVVSDCGQCNASKVAAFSAAPIGKDIKRIVLISNEIPVEEAKRRFGCFTNIHFGSLSNLQKLQLNVSFLPRVYLVDNESRLKFIQPPSFSYGQAFWSMQKREHQ